MAGDPRTLSYNGSFQGCILMAEENAHNVQYAGFPDRTAAFVLDTIIVGTLFFYLLEGVAYAGNFIGPLFFSGTATAFNKPEMPVIVGSAVAGTILFVLMCWLYSAGITSSSYSATFGKMIMGMKVTDVMGNRLSFWHATIRFIAKIFSGLILFIGFFMIHFSEKKQGLHDRFAGTYVVYGRKTVPVNPEAGPAMSRIISEPEEKDAEESRKNISKVLIWIIAIPVFLIFVTVVLAAVIAAFVFGMAGNVAHTYVVAATAQQPDATTIIVTYQGGQDASRLTSLDVQVNENNPAIWKSPAIGEQKIFSTGTAGKDHVLVTGLFENGAQQVILDTHI
jgi:uncharacterized RDD family membrane protein YckC